MRPRALGRADTCTGGRFGRDEPGRVTSQNRCMRVGVASGPRAPAFISGGSAGSGGYAFRPDSPQDGRYGIGLAGQKGAEIDRVRLQYGFEREDGHFNSDSTPSRGGQGGTPFSLLCPVGSALVVIFGRAGARVDQLEGFAR